MGRALRSIIWMGTPFNLLVVILGICSWVLYRIHDIPSLLVPITFASLFVLSDRNLKGIISISLLVISIMLLSGISDSAFTLADSDDRLYHDIALYVSRNVNLFTQFIPWKVDYIYSAGIDFGFVIPNAGYYKFLAICYSIFGENFTQELIYLNMCFFIISYYLFANAIYAVREKVDWITWIFALGFICNPAAIVTATSLRKDSIIFLLLVSTLYTSILKRYVAAILLAAILFQFRNIFFFVLLGVLIDWFSTKSRFIRDHFQALIILILSVCLLFTAFPSLVASLQSSDSDFSQFSNAQMNSTAFFRTNAFGRLLFPFIYSFPFRNSVFVAITTSLCFILQLIVFVLFLNSIYKLILNKCCLDSRSMFISAILYVQCVASVCAASYWKVYTLIEPRYFVTFSIALSISCSTIIGRPNQETESK